MLRKHCQQFQTFLSPLWNELQNALAIELSKTFGASFTNKYRLSSRLSTISKSENGNADVNQCSTKTSINLETVKTRYRLCNMAFLTSLFSFSWTIQEQFENNPSRGHLPTFLQRPSIDRSMSGMVYQEIDSWRGQMQCLLENGNRDCILNCDETFWKLRGFRILANSPNVYLPLAAFCLNKGGMFA